MGSATETFAQWVETLPGPGWLGDLRREAAAADAAQPLPRWDRTDAARIDLGAAGAAPADVPGGAEVDGALAAVRAVLPAGAEERGVVCDRIDRLAETHPDLVRRYLGRVVGLADGKFEARNAAAHIGYLLYVPDGVALRDPVEIVYRQGADGAPVHPRTVVGLGRAAEATVVQRQEGGAPSDARACALTAVVEAEVGEGAHLRFVDLQDWGGGVHAYVTRRAALGRDASVRWLIGELGGSVLRSATATDLAQPGGEALALLVFFASGSQHMDLATTLRHVGPRTNGHMLTKGVLAGHSRAIYRGTSDIERGARDSNSQQKENVLHLDPGVRSDAIPALYINENQLQAGHAATTGKVDAEQMFYLASRGLPQREALRLIVHGFFAPLVEQLPVASARARLEELVDRKIDGDAPPGAA